MITSDSLSPDEKKVVCFLRTAPSYYRIAAICIFLYKCPEEDRIFANELLGRSKAEYKRAIKALRIAQAANTNCTEASEIYEEVIAYIRRGLMGKRATA